MTEIVQVNAVNALKRVVDIEIETERKTRHRIGHLPGDGWFCICARGKSCKHIEFVKNLTPDMEK